MAVPVLLVDDIIAWEGGAAVFTLRLSEAAAEAVSVNYATNGQSASAGADYVSASGLLTFAPGETVRTITISLVDNAVAEGEETFRLLFSNPNGLVLGQSAATAAIVDNDLSDRAPLASVQDVSVNEGDGAAIFYIRLDRAASAPITVAYQTLPGSATAGADFTAISGNVTFAIGQTVAAVQAPIINDGLAESGEIFFLQLTGISGVAGAGLGDELGVARIGASDTAPAADAPVLLVDDITADEDGQALITFRLSAPSEAAVGFHYITSSNTGGALSGDDYLGVSGDLYFAPGQTIRTLSLTLTDNAVSEATESFNLVLSNADGLTLARSSVNISIIDNDASERAPIASVGDAAANEGDGLVSFTILLDRASSAPVTVSYETLAGSAAAGADFAGGSGSVTFSPGQTAANILIALSNDAAEEAIESFSLRLTGISGVAGAAIGDAVGVARIGDDDRTVAETPVLLVDDVVVDESGEAVFTFRLSAPSASAVGFHYITSSNTGGATSGNDYVGVSGDIYFAPGETMRTLSIGLVDDAAMEATESFNLILSNADGLTLGRTSVNAAIIDNDATERAPVASVLDGAVNEADGVAVFNVVLDRAAATTVTVNYHTTSGSAAAGADFIGALGSVSFAPGQTVSTVHVPIAQDAMEGMEIFSVRLTGISGAPEAALGDALAYAHIGASAPPAAIPVVTVDDIFVGEGGHAALFTFRLDAPSDSAVGFHYITSSNTGGASSGTDYVGVSGDVYFAPGETIRTVSIGLVDDASAEPAESFNLILSNADGLALGRTSVSATIIDNDAAARAPVVSALDTAVNESDGVAVFTIGLDQAAAAPVIVRYATRGGSAAAGVDFVSASGQVSFAPGQTTATVQIALVNDAAAEGEEAFFLDLIDISGAGATLGDAQAVARIGQSDMGEAETPVLLVDDIEVREGGQAVFTFRLSAPSASATGFHYITSSGVGGAVSGDDFVGVSGDLYFAPGETIQTVTIGLIDNLSQESAESFVLNLSNADGLTLGRSSVTATILDNDPVAVGLIAPTSLLAEQVGQSAVHTVTLFREGQTATPHTIYWEVTAAGANAVTGVDFVGGVLPSGFVEFAPGETERTITINLAADTGAEADEQFVLSLTDASPDVALIHRTLSFTVMNAAPAMVLHGGSAGETLRGDAGDDYLDGAGGGDTLIGGRGADLLSGGDSFDASVAGGQIFRLYRTTLDRAPDVFGYLTWEAVLQSGVTLEEMSGNFINSAEFQVRFGGLFTSEFVTQLYGTALLRAPDADGLAFWTAQIDAGAITREQAVLTFSESGEAQVLSRFAQQAFVTTEVAGDAAGQVFRLYRTTLDRLPDEGGFNYWTEILAGPATLADMAATFIASAEFQIRFGALSTSAFVTQLYQTALQRDPDAGGLAYWTAQIESGAITRDQAVLVFSESDEGIGRARQDLIDYFRSGVPSLADTLEGGGGDDLLFGGRGADTFVFDAGDDDADQVFGFEAHDVLRLTGFGYADWAEALTHFAQEGADVLFADSNVTVLFHETDLATIQQAELLVA